MRTFHQILVNTLLANITTSMESGMTRIGELRQVVAPMHCERYDAWMQADRLIMRVTGMLRLSTFRGTSRRHTLQGQSTLERAILAGHRIHKHQSLRQQL